jgi:hypothetical protein
LQVDRAFTLLSGNLSPKALEALFDEQFVPTLGSMMTTMTTGHIAGGGSAGHVYACHLEHA